jgi:hypothetical protein
METAAANVGAICCGHYEVDSATGRIVAEVEPHLRGHIFEALLGQGFFNHTSTVMVRAECFERVGLFDDTFPYGEDFDMWLRLARVYRFEFVAEPLVRLYFQPSGLTRNYRAIITGAEMHLAKYRDFFEENPRVYCRQLHRLGTYYCFDGNVERARELFCRAVRLNPGFPKNYMSLALSVVGSASFRRCYVVKDRIVELFANAQRMHAAGGQ